MLYWIRIHAPITNGSTSNEFYIGIFNISVTNTGRNARAAPECTAAQDVLRPLTPARTTEQQFSIFMTISLAIIQNSSITTGNIDGSLFHKNACWKVDNSLIFNQTCLPCNGTLPIVYISGGKYALLNSTENVAFDVDMTPFYGNISRMRGL